MRKSVGRGLNFPTARPRSRQNKTDEISRHYGLQLGSAHSSAGMLLCHEIIGMLM